MSETQQSNRESKLLFDEQPIVVSRELAKRIGLNEAIVLQQIHYWLEVNRKTHKNFIDGRYWTYNSMRNWHENDFSFWSFNTVQRTFSSLEKKGFLVTGNYNKQSFDHTKWYSIDYETLEPLKKSIAPKWGNRSTQSGVIDHPTLGQSDPLGQSITPKWGDRQTQNGVIENPNLGQTIPENYQRSKIHIEQSSLCQCQCPAVGTHESIDSKKPDKTLTPDDDMTSRERVVNAEEPKKKPPPFTPVSETYRQAEAPKKYSADDYTTYAELIKSNIDFESFSDPDDQKLAGSLIGIMLDVILTSSPDTVKIGKEIKSRDIARSVYLKLNHGHIAHVMSQYRAQSRRVIFKNAYLRTMLFNTYTELEAAAVNKKTVAANPEQCQQPQRPPAKETPQKKNRFINFDQREIDFDELERLELELLMSSMKD